MFQVKYALYTKTNISLTDTTNEIQNLPNSSALQNKYSVWLICNCGTACITILPVYIKVISIIVTMF